ncbi:ATP-binding cassette domain-containing protein [Herbiconiux sp. CPCC 203407]|uniref:ATP-binding cassette domain-containing protein n=1 Tax=Herbiconiux oxytropis TaxID=2970915 RepID=A0AA41XB53_9MICO|nr:ATP-binding cassette domain-containing protein [Herbiconiux oxytropis]MCS5720722.1 ATP-binding cassette domain-containing protein [Herbiconiux oxytropis]MCS5724951.1 ATP-binding cassette domain-containing protein [Herbiconiux oxytropis]
MDQTASRPVPLLTLTGIGKQYPGVRALDDVDVTVLPGEVHAILGENGAGKSTLVGIAAGSVVPNTGTIDLGGVTQARMFPRDARERGLAIVYQIPALAPSLTVVDAMLLLLPEKVRPKRREATAWTAELFARLGLEIDVRQRVSAISQREAHLVEIAAALASEPTVLVLDEPTEALGADETAWLFSQVHELLARGAGVVYITHRIPEVLEIGDRMTVLRDGKVVGRGDVAGYTADEIVELIVGRSLETTFPPKAIARGSDASPAPVLGTAGLTGRAFRDIDFVARSGEIVGLAGVEGNGQREFMKALAGSVRGAGSVRLDGQELRGLTAKRASAAGIVYLPGDRLGEAMFGQLSVRENVIAPNLAQAMPAGFVSPGTENRLVHEAIGGLAVKTPTIETPITSLSGGSQQKVLLARARLGSPRVLLVEDPTQGVDAGARVEIYSFLRAMADDGVAVVILSTDAVELEGLCDRVVVFSRGRVQAELEGPRLTEREITGAAVLATETSINDDADAAELTSKKGLPLYQRGEVQTVSLIVITIVLALITAGVAPSFLSPLSLGQLLATASILILVGLAQLAVVITGGIDLSIGSVVALSAVIVSFFGGGGPGLLVVGVVVAIAAGAVVGVVNGILITRLGMPPVIATLVSSIAVLGGAQLLRPQPGGQASADLMTALGTAIAGIPLVLVVAVVIAVLLWLGLGNTSLGRGFRAAGSDAVKANRMGVDVDRMRLTATVASGVLAAIAGIVLYTKTGIGDAGAAQAFTLTSVTAIVIAGVSIFGGSGSALAVGAAALLLQTITSALPFLNVNLSWQYWLQGLFVLVAAVLPMAVRLRRRRRIPE